MILVGGKDEIVAEWAGAMLNKKFVRPFAAWGVVNGAGQLCGAAIFNDYYDGGNIEMTYLGERTASRRLIRQLVQYAFSACNASRVTLKTARRNILVRKLIPRLGFAFEGTQKRYFGASKEDDALVFVLHRDRIPHWMLEGN